MAEKNLNPQIMEAIMSNCDNPNVTKFLMILLGIEADKTGQWHWKEVYLEQLRFVQGRDKD